IGAPVHTGRPLVHPGAGVRTRRPVPGRTIGGLHPDLPRPIQLRRVRVPGPFSLPVVDDARRLLPFLCRFAPLSSRQAAVLLPCAATHFQSAAALSRDRRKGVGGGLPLVAFRQGELAPQAFDANVLALVRDRLPKLLVDDFHLGRGGRSVVAYAGQAEEIAWKLRAVRMDDEGSAHSEDSTENTVV